MDGGGLAVKGRVAVVTLGCPKNLTDSEVMAGLLGREGFTVTDDLEAADGIVINTCAFIGPAREEAWGEIERAVALRRSGRCRALLVAGCLAQGFGPEIRMRAPEVDRLLGTGDVGRVSQAVASLLGGRIRPAAGAGGSSEFAAPGYVPTGDEPRLLGTPPHYAYLKIAEGCSHRCAFCLIPGLRGPYRSRPVGEVVREAGTLERAGVREIVLVAQDTTAYGRDLGGSPLLAKLAGRILEETGVGWLRVLYGYPSTLPGDYVALLAREAQGRTGVPDGAGRLCRYLDLPMQHASDRVLRAMRRPETGEMLLDLVGRLRREVPGITLRSTFIVGFPGETENDFLALLDFLRAARIEQAGFFAYSREEGTPAADLPDQVEDLVKEERLARVSQLQRSLCLAHRRSLVGSTLRVLVGDLRRGGRIWARTEGDAPEIDGRVSVRWTGRSLPEPGTFVWVKVSGARAYDLLAEGPAMQPPQLP